MTEDLILTSMPYIKRILEVELDYDTAKIRDKLISSLKAVVNSKAYHIIRKNETGKKLDKEFEEGYLDYLKKEWENHCESTIQLINLHSEEITLVIDTLAEVMEYCDELEKLQLKPRIVEKAVPYTKTQISSYKKRINSDILKLVNLIKGKKPEIVNNYIKGFLEDMAGDGLPVANNDAEKMIAKEMIDETRKEKENEKNHK